MLLPFLYRLSQVVLAPRSMADLSVVLRSWTAHHDVGNLAVDVGCGPRSILGAIGVRPIGLDFSGPAVSAYCRGSGPGVIAGATALPLKGGAVDSAWCVGLLHHLPDEEVGVALGELQRVTRPGGHSVVFDGVLPAPGSGLLARLIRRVDRGRWMRSREALERLLGQTGSWAIEPFRYSARGLEGVLATWTRPPRKVTLEVGVALCEEAPHSMAPGGRRPEVHR